MPEWEGQLPPLPPLDPPLAKYRIVYRVIPSIKYEKNSNLEFWYLSNK